MIRPVEVQDVELRPNPHTHLQLRLGKPVLPHAHAGHRLARRLGAAVGQAHSLPRTRAATCRLGQTLQRLLQSLRRAQSIVQGRIHGGDPRHEPVPPSQVDERIRQCDGEMPAHSDDLSATAPHVTPQQGGPYPARVPVHDLHPAQDRPHQWQPVGGNGGGARQHQVLAVLPVRRLEQQLVALHPRSLLPGRTGRVDAGGDAQPVVAEVRARARGAVEPGLVPHQRAQGLAVGQGRGGDRGGHAPMLPATPRPSLGAPTALRK